MKGLYYFFSLLCGFFIFFSIHIPIHASNSYDSPESMSPRPRDPDVLQHEGATIRRSPWVLTVPPNTFSYDVYFRHGCRKKTFPIRIGRYWQISDICEFIPRSHFNLAAAEVQRSWMLAYEYTDEDLTLIGGIAFPDETLKVVFSDDNGESWTMLPSSVVDTEGQSVAAITDKPGGYMIMAGFVNPKTFYSYKEEESVQGVSTGSLAEAERNSSLESLQTFVEGTLLFIGQVLR